MGYPIVRMRRMRRNETLRRMVRETRLSADNLVMPLFVKPEGGETAEIVSMPGQFQWPVDRVADQARRVMEAGVPAVLLFGLPEAKDWQGSSGYDPESVVCRAVRAIKEAAPELCVITDVCLCEYTDHGHCGLLRENRDGVRDVDNDASVSLLVKEAMVHADAGADVIAPSDMMDGRVAAIRKGLDEKGYSEIPIMAYSAKYASAFYGPFRDAAESAPQFGDRRSYQMDPSNLREAMREMALDLEEGADVLMVKPAMAYLDVLAEAHQRFDVPLAAYHVSGEYSMVKAAAERGWIDERRAALEMLTALRRAGASIIITYWACEAAGWLNES
jgi:porphobilinogen synthase